ncbi:hypothetical protein PGIGA_G00008330 [Pangasianodon gigas]|uniref:Uncharacterized protein n=1 Tax=Pangasianodon gigas TaxID=30993 RepID=A0ACC5W6D0_PANGG|nr:hypothetical protein [Pangasianodon gigas]
MFFYTISVVFFWALLANKFATDSSENTFSPCTDSAKTDAYERFLNKHVRPDTPKTLDQNEWQAFIRRIGTCNRPVQSFIPFAQKQRVANICSPSGGKTYINNLCVSKQEFTFTTVNVDNNCIVRSVISETKYLLLACDNVQGYCLPVHFEPNPNNDGPDNKNPDCKNPYQNQAQNQAQFAHLNLSLLILTLLSTALAHFM